MRKSTIHVGLHKTATTFLQNSIFPKLGETCYLSRPYTQLNHAFNKLQYADDSRYDKQEFLVELSKLDRFGKHLLMSDEMFSGVPHFNYINRSVIAQRLQSIFPNASIVLFLRGQNDLILSLHNSWVKNIGGTRTIDSFLKFPSRSFEYEEYDPSKIKAGNFGGDTSAYYFHHDNFTLNLSNFFYYELVSLYKGLFKNVHVFLFEDFLRDPIEVTKKLELILGDCFMDIDNKQLKERLNTSITRVDLEARRFRNAIQELTSNRMLLKASEWWGRSNAVFFRKQSDKEYLKTRLDGFYVENNRKLIQNYPEIRLEDHPDKYQL